MNPSSMQALPIHAGALAWRQLRRDLRAGELRLLLVAVMLAVGALTAVGFFADRINSALARDARALLGGDAVVASDQPVPPAFAARAAELKLRTSNQTTFPSMARAPDDRGGAARLAAVKAVSESYPLRGQLTLRGVDGAAQQRAAAPTAGQAWVDAALLDALQLKIGDALLLGDARFTIERVIDIEPDRGAGFVGFAPRVMIAQADLPSTGLIQPASRVTYRFTVAADGARGDDAVAQFVRWAEERQKAAVVRGLRIESLESGRPEMRQTLDRAEKFLNLVALLAALLAAVAVAIAARDFAQRRLDDCAVLRVLGAPQRAIGWAYALEFGSVGLVASGLGVLLGLLVHQVFVGILRGLVVNAGPLPPPGVMPALFGLGVGITLLVSFGLPPVLQLARVPPLRVMRRDLGALRPASVLVLGSGAAGFVALLLAASSDWKLGALAVGGFAASALLLAALSYAAVRALQAAVPESRAPRWLVLATRQVAARPAYAVLQVSALGLGLLALVLLVLVRTDLVASWRAATPADAPNRFVINLQPDQTQPFQQRLRDAGVGAFDWYPMIRGRLVAINGKPIEPDSFADDRARRLVEREFNLSHQAQMPPHNSVIEGRWRDDERDGLSVEESVMTSLALSVGDRVTFDMAGQTREARITSVRKVDWSSMRVNFFVMFPVAAMEGLPVTYVSAFRAPDAPGFDNALARDFPNITSINVSASIAQVQKVLGQVVRAVEFLFGFTLATGLVVLFAAVSATRESRAREYAVMRALGAGARLLGQVQRAELLGVGALAGFLASVAAAVVGALLARYVFEFTWTASPWVPLAGMVAGALLALAAGWLGLRGVLRRPVVDTLRRAAQ